MLACSKSRLAKPCPETVCNKEKATATDQKAKAATVTHSGFVCMFERMAARLRLRPDPQFLLTQEAESRKQHAKRSEGGHTRLGNGLAGKCYVVEDRVTTEEQLARLVGKCGYVPSENSVRRCAPKK